MDGPSHFETAHLADDLHGHAIRGGAATLFGQGCRFIVQAAVTVSLARLLTPEDFGLFGMAYVVVTCVLLFKDLGLPMATVRSPTITHSQVSNLFWVNVALGCGLAAATAVGAPLVARFFHDTRLTAPTAAMAVLLVCAGLAGQHQALLKRQMRFGALAAIDSVAFLAAGAAAILSAWLGAKYWALVMLQLVVAVTTAAGAWIACDWRPGAWKPRANIRTMLRFGRHVAGLDVLAYLSGNIDHVAIGWCWGAASLGFYDKAYQILLLPMYQLVMPMTSVVQATLSRLVEHREQYRAYLARSIRVTAGVGMPFVAFLFVMADRVIPFVFGPRWISTVPIYRALAPAALVNTFAVGISWMLVSLGETRRLFRWMLFTTAVTVTCLLIAVQWGPVAVAGAYSACRLAYPVPSLLFCCRRTPVRWTDVLLAAAPPAMASTGSALVLIAARWSLPAVGSPLLEIVMDGLVFGGCYLMLVASLAGVRQTRVEAGRVFRALRQNRNVFATETSLRS